MGSQGKNCFPSCPHFPAKIAAFGLKYCILKENAKNNISGRRTKPLRGGPF
jgi:hypothetical protein